MRRKRQHVRQLSLEVKRLLNEGAKEDAEELKKTIASLKEEIHMDEDTNSN